MNDQTNEENTVDVDALNAAVETAEAAVESAKTAEKEAREALKETKKNHKLAVNYAKNPPEDQAEAAKESAEGWAVAVEGGTQSVEDHKQALKDAREALKEAKKAAKAAGAGKTPAVQRPEQNGQRQPAPESKSGQLWAIFDAATAERGSPCAITDVMEQCEQLGMTEGSIRSCYSHWRKFNGIPKGRIMSLTAGAMSAEEREAKITKYTEQLEKAKARVEKLTEQLNAVEAAEVVSEAA